LKRILKRHRTSKLRETVSASTIAPVPTETPKTSPDQRQRQMHNNHRVIIFIDGVDCVYMFMIVFMFDYIYVVVMSLWLVMFMFMLWLYVYVYMFMVMFIVMFIVYRNGHGSTYSYCVFSMSSGAINRLQSQTRL
jgi:hypothetical protein